MDEWIIRWIGDDGGLYELPTACWSDGTDRYSVDYIHLSEREAIEDARKWKECGGEVDGFVVILRVI